MVAVRLESKSEAVAHAIQEDIARQALEPGASLGKKTELAARYSVSPGTLNESLRLLQASGTVTMRPGPGGGVFVASTTPKLHLRNIMVSAAGAEAEVAGLVAVRDELEVLVALEAARTCTAADAAELRAQLDHIAGLPKGRDETLQIWKLHRMIAAVGSNQFLTRVYTEALDRIEMLVVEFSVSHRPAPGVRGDAVEVHRELVEAVASGDEERARDAAIAHTPVGHRAR